MEKKKKRIFAMTDKANSARVQDLIKKIYKRSRYEIFYVGDAFNKYDLLRFEPDCVVENLESREIFEVKNTDAFARRML